MRGSSVPGLARILLIFLLGPGALQAAEPEAPSNAELARATSDPTSDLWFVFTEFSLSFLPEEDFRRANAMTIELQPSMPVPLTKNWRFLNYPELVLATEGTPAGWQVTGVESLSWMGALSPAARNGFSWGVGPYVAFPVSTDERLASSEWQFGTGGVVAWRTEKFVVSTVVKSGWTTSGAGDEAGTLQVQYNAQYFFGDGLQVGLGHPTIAYTWDRDGRGNWDVPVGLDFARTFHLGKLPVKIMLEYDFFVINDSQWKPEHLFRLTILPVIPGPFKAPIFE